MIFCSSTKAKQMWVIYPWRPTMFGHETFQLVSLQRYNNVWNRHRKRLRQCIWLIVVTSIQQWRILPPSTDVMKVVRQISLMCNTFACGPCGDIFPSNPA
mmetsp:Transcript_44167/g.79284  ORF Transcript_44167/g.79284 Transcript_44167/m.79284 type:complete len:100 (-) Transcript_44167:453-752(-)